MNYAPLDFDLHKKTIHEIRRKVFIEEQHVPEDEEYDDEEDNKSEYFGALYGGSLIAILRLRTLGVDFFKLERVAVLEHFRKRGVASRLVRFAMVSKLKTTPTCSILAYAQETAIQLYTSLGFLVLTHMWIEEETNIPHRTIFWSTPPGLNQFLTEHEKNLLEDGHALAEHSIFHPNVFALLVDVHEKTRTSDFWNLQSFHVFLDDNVLSYTLVERFIDFCKECEKFLNYMNNLNIYTVLPVHDSVSRSECQKKFEITNRVGSKIAASERFLTEIVEDNLNTTLYGDRSIEWQRLNALLCTLKSFVLSKIGQKQAAMKMLDRGIVMGDIEENVFPMRRFAEKKHDRLEVPIMSLHPSFANASENRTLKTIEHATLLRVHSDKDTIFENTIEAISRGEPLLIKNYAADWKAVHSWNFERLFAKLHSRKFPVEVGSSYSGEDWKQVLMTFKEFCENKENKKIYIAQHDVLQQIPSLMKDIMDPEECFANNTDVGQICRNMWIGPADTVSPLHQDPRKNLFVQIHGTKLFRLTKPSNEMNIYPHEYILKNTSQVDVEYPDYEKFPKFKDVEMFDAVVEPGDALYIPEKWFHYVRSVSPSISISFWFD